MRKNIVFLITIMFLDLIAYSQNAILFNNSNAEINFVEVKTDNSTISLEQTTLNVTAKFVDNGNLQMLLNGNKKIRIKKLQYIFASVEVSGVANVPVLFPLYSLKNNNNIFSLQQSDATHIIEDFYTTEDKLSHLTMKLNLGFSENTKGSYQYVSKIVKTAAFYPNPASLIKIVGNLLEKINEETTYQADYTINNNNNTGTIYKIYVIYLYNKDDGNNVDNADIKEQINEMKRNGKVTDLNNIDKPYFIVVEYLNDYEVKMPSLTSLTKDDLNDRDFRISQIENSISEIIIDFEKRLSQMLFLYIELRTSLNDNNDKNEIIDNYYLFLKEYTFQTENMINKNEVLFNELFKSKFEEIKQDVDGRIRRNNLREIQIGVELIHDYYNDRVNYKNYTLDQLDKDFITLGDIGKIINNKSIVYGNIEIYKKLLKVQARAIVSKNIKEIIQETDITKKKEKIDDYENIIKLDTAFNMCWNLIKENKSIIHNEYNLFMANDSLKKLIIFSESDINQFEAFLDTTNYKYKIYSEDTTKNETDIALIKNDIKTIDRLTLNFKNDLDSLKGIYHNNIYTVGSKKENIRYQRNKIQKKITTFNNKYPELKYEIKLSDNFNKYAY